MTTQELLDMIDAIYPNGENDEIKIIFMNIAIHSLSRYLGMIGEDSSLVTVADQDCYDFPTGIDDVSQIVDFGIGNSATPSDRYSYTRYSLSHRDSNPQKYNAYWQIVDSSGDKKLAIYPIPSVSDLPIVIRYKMNITDLDADDTSVEPDFDVKYHELIAFYCVSMLCSMGASPDYSQADNYMQKYENGLKEIKREKMNEAIKHRNKYNCNEQWIKYKSFGVGF